MKGEFISLSPLTYEHLPDLERDFDPNLFKYYPKPYSTARKFVEENFELQKSGNFFPFAIIHLETNKAIGCTEFSGFDRKNKKLEIGGSWIKKAFQGSAANSEAKLLLLCHCFEILNFVRVQFTAHSMNIQSRTGIERIGGKLEGILRNAMILPDGTLRDDACYSIVASEWPALKWALSKRLEQKRQARIV